MSFRTDYPWQFKAQTCLISCNCAAVLVRNYEKAESSEEGREVIEEVSLTPEVSWMTLPENMSEMDYIRAAAMVTQMWIPVLQFVLSMMYIHSEWNLRINCGSRNF